MNIEAFFAAVKAEFVGGRIKAVVNGVHHWIAEFVDGNIVLTTAGHEILAGLATTAPHLTEQLKDVPGAVKEIEAIAANPSSLVAGGVVGALGAVDVEAVAKDTAASAVDAAFAELDKVVPTKKAKVAK